MSLNYTGSVFSVAKAIELAATLNAEEEEEGGDDWSYRLDPDPNGSGKCRIKIYDEDDEFVGYM